MIPALMTLCIVGPGWAQDSTKAEAKNPLKPGVWALEIETQGTLSSWGRAGVSGKKNLNSRSAIEAGVTLQVFGTETDGVSTYFESNLSGSTTNSGPSAQHVDYNDVGVFIHYVTYAHVWDRVALLWGAGPVARWHSGSNRYSDSYYDGSYSNNSSHQETWGIGLGAIAGFEWFFAGRLSLGGRVGITGLYEQGSQSLVSQNYFASATDYFSQSRSGDIDQWSVITNPTTLVLSIYF
jgi:hypothetical protein